MERRTPTTQPRGGSGKWSKMRVGGQLWSRLWWQTVGRHT
ncbi:hypothetical protein ERO13_A11G113400v2 [Gossypium hirsutum]|uniref:Uncharacterized protein n=2 Tax=Gossypium TaxID=3633 RepID=A0A5D2X526_GOSMU|nr:hypothetical protein ERO13_A11G113400v2 [Gossypium hirsutum]TYI00355.1 hypothetical protein ES332_A11G128800v1 [Gossypium tomentosum]TYJ09208.1 hypothetical protein E1A91_A11G125000v1 [Gossypium mustelinum]